MLHKIKIKLKSLNSSHILAILFLLFTVCVGIGALPQLLENTKTAVQNRYSLNEFIDAIDEQYYDVLSIEKGTPLLRNKGTYINLNGLMARVLGQPLMNERIKLSNGHLTPVPPVYKDEDVEAAAENLKALHKQLSKDGKRFLFVVAPLQVSPEETGLPNGYTDTENDSANYLLRLLEESGVPYLDLRDCMEEDGIAYSDAFFVTDHHWRPETGFWAYTRILEKLQEIGTVEQISEFYTSKENYEFRIYEDSFLGSSGKRTGRYYAGVDDFCVIAPKFETNISVTIEEPEVDLQGPYEEVSYKGDMDAYLSDPDYFSDNPYGRYGWGDTPLTQWRNENAPEDKSVMLIGDSFGNVPFSLMPLYFSSCDELDMRYFTGDFQAHYEDCDPDTVVLLVNVDQIEGEIVTYPYFPG